jgi:hypothetical protein
MHPGDDSQERTAGVQKIRCNWKEPDGGTDEPLTSSHDSSNHRDQPHLGDDTETSRFSKDRLEACSPIVLRYGETIAPTTAIAAWAVIGNCGKSVGLSGSRYRREL